MLSSRCTVLATRGKRRKLTLLGRRAPSLVVASVVVPGISKVALAGRVGDGGRAIRVPLIVLSTGGAASRGVRNVRSKTSTCVPGPFGARCLMAIVERLVGGRERLRRCCGSSTDTFSFKKKRLLRGRSGRCLRATERLVGGGVSGALFKPRRLTTTVRADDHGLCHGFGGLGRPSPGSFVGRRQVACTTGLLLAAALAVRRIVCGATFAGHSRFCGRFTGHCGRAPERCERMGGRGSASLSSWEDGLYRSMIK